MLTETQIRFLRLRSQRLLAAKAPASPTGVLKDIFAVQAQDLPAARLSIQARSAGETALSVENARQEERSIVWIWALRGTLHLLTAKDCLWLIPFLGPDLILKDQRRLYQLGWDERKVSHALRLIESTIERQGGLTRQEIRQLLEDHHLPSEGQAPIHLLYRGAMECRLCPGPDRDGSLTYVGFEEWIGKPRVEDRPAALAQLARRYLKAYAPAGPADLAAWSGLKMEEARRAFQLVKDETVMVETKIEPAWLLKEQAVGLEDLPDDPLEGNLTVRLLPRFDAYLLGYKSRDFCIDPKYARRIHPGGGMILTACIINGKVQGTWKTRKRKKGLEILLEPFETLPDEAMPLLAREASEIGRFLGQETELTITKPGI